MKKTFYIYIIFLFSKQLFGQATDTLINVGNGRYLHFTITKGKNAPILFESGFGNGADVWKNITKQIAKVTEATIITYDRLSYSDNLKNYQIGIENEINALETGLTKLGYSKKDIMLVAHSLGGMYCSLYSSRHPHEVKASVFIDDANICSLTSHFQNIKLPQLDTIENYLASVLDAVRKKPMPTSIPLIDIVADTHFDDNGNPDTVWLSCHKQFVSQSPNRKLLLAYNVGHYVFVENQSLVVNSIISQYANYLAPKNKLEIIENGLKYSQEMFNEIKKNQVKCGQTEDDLTTWGYSLLEKGEVEKAIEVFKLNVTMNPEGWNTYDSLGEAYLKIGNKTEAIKNYKKSLELNPKNDNATKVLGQLK